jgi:hypothetical protein
MAFCEGDRRIGIIGEDDSLENNKIEATTLDNIGHETGSYLDSCKESAVDSRIYLFLISLPTGAGYKSFISFFS